MSLAALLALSATGFAVGLLAGLVGIGGGVLIVPFLYFFYGHAAWSGVTVPETLQAAVSHATSLFIIVPTAIVGTWTYARAKRVRWSAVLPMAVAATVAGVIAARLATRVPGSMLQLAFGAFLVFTAVQLLRGRVVPHATEPRTALPVMLLTGAVVGMFSAMLGVGGGLVAIPLLMYLVRLPIDEVAATSLALVAFAASAGTLSYMTNPLGTAAMPPGLVGHVHVLAALPMLPGAMIAARWGARLNQKMDATWLRRIFAILFLLMGLRMVLTNLPLPGV